LIVGRPWRGKDLGERKDLGGEREPSQERSVPSPLQTTPHLPRAFKKGAFRFFGTLPF